MLQNGLTTWTELYHNYTRLAAKIQSLSHQYLANIRLSPAHTLSDFLDSDDNMDIIVGDKDGLLYLLRNVQAFEDNGTFWAAGIIGQSFTDKYKQTSGNTGTNLFVKVQQGMNKEVGERAAQQWVNAEITYLNRRRMQKDGPSTLDAREGEEMVSTWLREIQARVQHVLGNDYDYIFEKEERETDVSWDGSFPLQIGLHPRR